MLTETDQQLKNLGVSGTHVIASVGVGSFAHAVTMHYKAKQSRATVITVEPESAASLKESLLAGRITPISTGHTIMAGMCCGTTSTTAWKVLKHGVDVSVTVNDINVHKDLQYLHRLGVRIGPCGAAPLTALRKLCKESKDVIGLNEQSVVILFSTEGARDYIIPGKT